MGKAAGVAFYRIEAVYVGRARIFRNEMLHEFSGRRTAEECGLHATTIARCRNSPFAISQRELPRAFRHTFADSLRPNGERFGTVSIVCSTLVEKWKRVLPSIDTWNRNAEVEMSAGSGRPGATSIFRFG